MKIIMSKTPKHQNPKTPLLWRKLIYWISKFENKMENIRIASRCTHMLSTMIISGITIYNYLSESNLQRKLTNQSNYSFFYYASIFFMFTSGILNIFINKNGKKLENPIWKIWIHFFEFKFILALLLTPVIYTVTSPFASD